MEILGSLEEVYTRFRFQSIEQGKSASILAQLRHGGRVSDMLYSLDGPFAPLHSHCPLC